MKSKLNALLGALLLGTLSAPAASDVLLMDSVRATPENSPAGVLRPEPGMRMAAVEQRFGAPAQRIGPVGEPPISRWVYDRYTVYFENDLVLHSVVKRPAAAR